MFYDAVIINPVQIVESGMYAVQVSVTPEIIGDKWKPYLINSIHKGIHRPSELARHNPTASKRVLILQLKELEEHGVIRKVIYPVLPPKVEYFLTGLGESLLPIVALMETWGENVLAKGLAVKKGR